MILFKIYSRLLVLKLIRIYQKTLSFDPGISTIYFRMVIAVFNRPAPNMDIRQLKDMGLSRVV